MTQRHWINAVPAEVALAPDGRAHALLDTLEGPDFTGDTGLFHTGRGGGPDGEGELRVWTLPSSVMAVGEANFGRLGDDQALFYVHSVVDQLDLEMPGALPEIAPSPRLRPVRRFPRPGDVHAGPGRPMEPSGRSSTTSSASGPTCRSACWR